MMTKSRHGHDNRMRKMQGTFMPRQERPDLARTPGRLFDRDRTERTTSNKAFVLFHNELLMVFEPCLVIPDLEKLRVEFSTGTAAHT